MKEKARKSMRSLFVLLLCLCTSIHVFAQEREISGTVTDDKGEAVPFATVKVKDMSIGTQTDFDGKYTLKVPADAKEVEISFTGYETQTLPISGSKVDATIKETSELLEEFVTIGYQQVRKADLVTSTTSIGQDQIKNIPVTSAAEAMQGKMAGVNVVTEDGSPDASIKVRVRGGSSLTQSAEPLYIVDGFPVSSISDISPSDIKSIDVLKDAASTAIYGAQGANGVVIVTTKDADDNNKKGDKGKFNFNVDYTGYMGFKKQAKKYDMLSVEEFVRLQYENAYLTKKGDISSEFSEKFDNAAYANGTFDKNLASSLPSILNYWGEQPSIDWQDETFGRTGTNMNHSLTVSAGNKIANVKLSYNRIDDKGIMHESNYIRNNVSLKANIKPIKNLSISVTGRYIDTEVLGAGTNTDKSNEGSSTQSRVRNALAYTPITFLSSQEIDEDLVQEGSMFDPITVIDDNYKLKTDNKWGINGNISYKFLKDFRIKTEWGYEAQTKNEDRFYGQTSSFTRNGIGVFGGSDGERGYPSTVITESDKSTFRNSNTLEYKKAFKGGHNLTVFVGEEMISKKNEWIKQSTIGYQEILSARETVNGKSSIPHKYRWETKFIDPDDNMLSFFGRADYNYKSRYYIAATLRADGSNRFTEDNRWGYFPSSALAWRMSDETWFKGFARKAKISDLKWRFSYGVAGNNNVDLGVLYNTIYLDHNIQDNAVIDVYTPTKSDVMANPNLKWETTTTRNLGLDYGFFGSRLNGAIDLYWNTTDDLIIRKRTGSLFRYENMGETESKGVEFSVQGVILDKRSKKLNYNLTVDANVSFNESKIISLGGVSEYQTSTGYLNGYVSSDEFFFEEGKGLGRVYGYVYDGFYTANDFDSYDAKNFQWKKDGNIVNTPMAATGVGARPGMMKLKDADGDGVADMEIIGNTMPLCSGGFTISGNVGGDNWGNVDIAAGFTYSIGNDVINLTGLDLTTIYDKTRLQNKLSTVAYGSRYSLFSEDGVYIPSYYHPAIIEDDENPVIVAGDEYMQMVEALNSANSGASIYNPAHNKNALTSDAIEDGSFLRFASLTVGYSLPDKWINKAYITKARIFFTASNLFCLTNYSGNDPEVDVAASKNPLNVGVDWSAYPKARAFNFGINLSF